MDKHLGTKTRWKFIRHNEMDKQSVVPKHGDMTILQQFEGPDAELQYLQYDSNKSLSPSNI